MLLSENDTPDVYVIRTDFSDAEGWTRVSEEIRVCDTVRNSCGLAIGALPGLLCLPGLPKGIERLVVAQVVGTQLQNRFGSCLRPELLRPLHALVELLHRRLDVAARDRQPLPAILGVAHLVLMVLQVRQRLGHDLTRVG